MTITLYEAAIPVFIKNIGILSKVLEKGRVHASADEAAMIEKRLVGDMGNLAFQIQRVSDCAKGVAVRAGGVAPVALPDTETTFPELQARLQKTIDILKDIKEDEFNATQDKQLTIPSGRDKTIVMTGKEYILDYAIPNFFFHHCMTYAILRKEGVSVGKNDYLGRV